MKVAFLVTALLALCGCVTVSPVLPAGDHAWMVSVVSHSQWEEAIESGVIRANEFCAKRNRRAKISSRDTKASGTDFSASSRAQVWFTCVEPDDKADGDKTDSDKANGDNQDNDQTASN